MGNDASVLLGAAWAVGVEIYVIDEEGSAQPLADGDYTLEDGTALKVADGRIAVLGAEEAAEEAEPVEMAEEDPLLAELKAIGLEDELAAKVMELMAKKKQEMSEEKEEAVVELAKQTAAGLEALATRLSKLEDAPGAQGQAVSPAPKKTNLSAEPSAFGWENALNVINNFR